MASIILTSRQKAVGEVDFFPAFLASMNCFDSGKNIRMIPTPIEIPAKKGEERGQKVSM